jgi:uncharacterized membrane protein (UPF0182 family)
VPFSTNDQRKELQAYMTASSDRDSYGELITYVVAQDDLPAGPLLVADQAESNSDISRELSLQANRETGTNVKFGDLQPIPVSDGLIYIRPVYVTTGDLAEYRFVIVSHNNRSVLDTDLSRALSRLFPGFDADIGERLPDPDQPDTTGDGTTVTPDEPVVISGDAAELATEAERLYTEAQELLRAGDLGGYQERVDQMGEILSRLADELNAADS